MRIIDGIKQKKIYGIIREDDPDYSYEIARAYLEGGIKFIELNCPIEVTKKVSALKGAVVAQGGIITTAQAHEALKEGAAIISSPIFQTNLVRFASCYKAFLIPSVTTPNEAYNAWRARMPLIKVYPVAEMGGVEYIRDLVKPMPFLNLLPCGFVKLDEIKGYLNAGAIAVGIGRELSAKKSYSEIVSTVHEVVEMVSKG
ncbi:MAG: bifunctional 4-hydroxy-2-oxoglutarate aldolase/2-dehydro-3-deoxy-phosphogluconate aldolase [Candidatus Gastranaerophilales bacterium]|nr:bifunctional 4-hydroxy-2-oxoglutarate aldolase/2-dehydro-3-deoxy-phosphogluconate aldolase [Candidatus Gastranaerophilales bacterium]